VFGEFFEQTETVAIAIGAETEEEAFAGLFLGGDVFGIDANDFADLAPDGIGLAVKGVAELGDDFALKDFGRRRHEDVVVLADTDAGFVAELALEEGFRADEIGERVRKALGAAGENGQVETGLGVEGTHNAQEQKRTHCYYDLPYAACLDDFRVGGPGSGAGAGIRQGQLHEV
jgi:hypothetical protein